jgi:hypothetical protein
LTNSRDIRYYTTFPTAEKLFAKVPAWNAAKIEEERKIIFEEFVEELKNAETVRLDFHYTKCDNSKSPFVSVD